jgi:hypothetical protein
MSCYVVRLCAVLLVLLSVVSGSSLCSATPTHGAATAAASPPTTPSTLPQVCVVCDAPAKSGKGEREVANVYTVATTLIWAVMWVVIVLVVTKAAEKIATVLQQKTE